MSQSLLTRALHTPSHYSQFRPFRSGQDRSGPLPRTPFIAASKVKYQKEKMMPESQPTIAKCALWYSTIEGDQAWNLGGLDQAGKQKLDAA
jgi:hypothetical protein